MPEELIGFYKKHIDYLSEHSVDADKRRYAIKEEAPRHYIDIDHYGKNPFEVMPRKWTDAVEKFSEDTLLAYGIVPWHIQTIYNRLVLAFQQKDIDYIFIPQLISMERGKERLGQTYNCPYVQALPDMILSAIDIDKDKILRPVIKFKEGRKSIEKELINMGRQLKIPSHRIIKAFWIQSLRGNDNLIFV